MFCILSEQTSLNTTKVSKQQLMWCLLQKIDYQQSRVSSSWSGLTVLLSRHSARNYPETSSHTTCQETFGHSHLSLLSHCRLFLTKSGISVRELILTPEKKHRQQRMVKHFSKILTREEKATTSSGPLAAGLGCGMDFGILSYTFWDDLISSKFTQFNTAIMLPFFFPFLF